ncbi:MAG: chemotaxis protein CheW, partial [Polyangiaceae bacterium]|nr:chemotaxis protein CheW [Polyangiaceae bacterium]
IVEIVPMLALGNVDGQNDLCRGIANLRGELIPVFDLTGPSEPLLPSRFILVARAGDMRIGLIVDDVHDVLGIEDDRLLNRPVGGGRTSLLVNHEGAALAVINPAEAIGYGA